MFNGLFNYPKFKSVFSALFLGLILSGCATVGKDFSENKVSSIEINTTSKAQIKALFGSPWRVGSESGETTWTYGLYEYSAFSNTQTKDIVIRFNADGTVASYTFNTTKHSE